MIFNRLIIFPSQIAIAEVLHVVGLALLTFETLPGLSAVKGAMVLSSVCLVPAILSKLTASVTQFGG